MTEEIEKLLKQEINHITYEYNKINSSILKDDAQKSRWLQQIENNNKRNRELRAWIYNIDKNHKSRIERRSELEKKKKLKQENLNMLTKNDLICPKKLELNGSTFYYYVNNKKQRNENQTLILPELEHYEFDFNNNNAVNTTNTNINSKQTLSQERTVEVDLNNNEVLSKNDENLNNNSQQLPSNYSIQVNLEITKDVTATNLSQKKLIQSNLINKRLDEENIVQFKNNITVENYIIDSSINDEVDEEDKL